jgi:hypothetical protein
MDSTCDPFGMYEYEFGVRIQHPNPYSKLELAEVYSRSTYRSSSKSHLPMNMVNALTR